MLTSRFISTSLGSTLLLSACPAFAQLTTTLSEPLHITDAAALGSDVTITYLENWASVRVDTGLNQTFINRITPLEPDYWGRLVLGGNATSPLDFTGKGEYFIITPARNVSPTISGSWTPGGSTYFINGNGFAGELVGGNWVDPDRITFAGTNTFVNNAGPRQVAFDSLAFATISAAQSYSGGTTITGGSTISVGATGSLGSGAVTIAGESDSNLPTLHISGGGTIINNTIHLGSDSQPSAAPGLLQVSGGAQLGGNVYIHPLDPNGPQTAPGTVWIGGWDNNGIGTGGTFSGTIYANGAARVAIFGEGNFAGSVQTSLGANLIIELLDGKITGPLVLGAGTTLVLNTYNAPSGGSILADLTLNAGTTVVSEYGYGTVIGAGANVFIDNAQFDATASFGYAENWDESKLAGFERLIFTADYSYSPLGTLQGTFRSVNNPEGYSVRFEYRRDNTELWAIVAPAAAVPEPASFAMLGGLVAAGCAVLRRRRQG